jgi:hypothetical protein
MFPTRFVAVITLALFAFQATAAPIPGVTVCTQVSVTTTAFLLLCKGWAH